MPSLLTVEKLHVVILYESMRYVGKAMAASLHLVQELADDFTPDFHLWRLDMVVEPACAMEAERDLAAAGVIIVAINGNQPCPPVFERWWGGRDRKASLPSRAIIALVEASEGPAPASGSWNHLLRAAATQIHPEVFVWNPPPDRDHGSWAAGDLPAGTQLPTPGHQP